MPCGMNLFFLKHVEWKVKKKKQFKLFKGMLEVSIIFEKENQTWTNKIKSS